VRIPEVSELAVRLLLSEHTSGYVVALAPEDVRLIYSSLYIRYTRTAYPHTDMHFKPVRLPLSNPLRKLQTCFCKNSPLHHCAIPNVALSGAPVGHTMQQGVCSLQGLQQRSAASRHSIGVVPPHVCS
jgi:hypothetical protein